MPGKGTKGGYEPGKDVAAIRFAAATACRPSGRSTLWFFVSRASLSMARRGDKKGGRGFWFSGRPSGGLAVAPGPGRDSCRIMIRYQLDGDLRAWHIDLRAWHMAAATWPMGDVDRFVGYLEAFPWLAEACGDLRIFSTSGPPWEGSSRRESPCGRLRLDVPDRAGIPRQASLLPAIAHHPEFLAVARSAPPSRRKGGSGRVSSAI